MRHLTSLAAAACAVATLSACSAATQPPTATPAGTPPSSAAPAPSATAGAGTRPVTATASKPAAVPAPSWKSIDWKSVTTSEMPNCPKKTEVESVHYADLTGDGLTEAIVAAACWTDTSQNPINVFIYDGADRRVPLDRLLRIGEDQYLKTATVRTTAATITVTSDALSDKAPRCCPDLRITQKYEWRDAKFHRVSLVEKPLE